MADRLEILTCAEMARADQLTIARGTPGIALMEQAGAAVAAAIAARWAPEPVLVLCGPGNNGGDGFVVARLLREAGWPVRLALLGQRPGGDAALAAARWTGPVEPLDPARIGPEQLIVDALFGAGLARPVDGIAAAALQRAAGARLVAVDVPSGVHGDTGEVWGQAAAATLTVTFFRKKPAHLLLPGRTLCGEIVVADIGIPDSVLAEIRPALREIGPPAAFPWPRADSHKYRRGHVLVLGGGRMTGAARLAAMAARRIGAGLVTIAAPAAAFAIYAGGPPGTIVVDRADWAALVADRRYGALVVGPGAGIDDTLAPAVAAALAVGKPTVLDGDAFAALPGKLPEHCVLTPHDGEFARVFDIPGDRLTRARAAARKSGTVVLLKGADTVIAAPDGRAVINANAPPELATAGAGDVLAGMIAGLIAQGLDGFRAAAVAAWLHGDAAARFGPGLIAEDLIETLPAALRGLRQKP